MYSLLNIDATGDEQAGRVLFYAKCEWETVVLYAHLEIRFREYFLRIGIKELAAAGFAQSGSKRGDVERFIKQQNCVYNAHRARLLRSMKLR